MGAARIGVVGTGFIARGLVDLLSTRDDMRVSRVLTRSLADGGHGFPRDDLLTDSPDQLVDDADLVVECSGDVVHATDVIDTVLSAGRPVVTMDAEFHVTTGSWFAGRGPLTEARGDQPGCLAALHEELTEAGFQILVYGNIKRFLDPDPTPEEMHGWAQRQGLSLAATTAFTDGTKVNIEQALVANGLGADIAREGLLAPTVRDVASGAKVLADAAEEAGGPLSDFVLCPTGPRGVFVVARHDTSQQAYLRYLDLGEGPRYTLVRNDHLIHLEIPSTIRRVLQGGGALLDNGPCPRVGVGAFAKRDLSAGQRIERGIGGFEVRGRALRLAEHPGHVPIGLLRDAVLVRDVEAGALLGFDDVELPDSLALSAWRQIEARVLHPTPGPA